MSSKPRTSLPADVLAHPALEALTRAGRTPGILDPEQVRLAADEAGLTARQLKPLVGHLAAEGIVVEVASPSGRAAAATTKKASATKAPATKAPAKKDAAKATSKSAPAKKAPAQ